LATYPEVIQEYFQTLRHPRTELVEELKSKIETEIDLFRKKGDSLAFHREREKGVALGKWYTHFLNSDPEAQMQFQDFLRTQFPEKTAGLEYLGSDLDRGLFHFARYLPDSRMFVDSRFSFFDIKNGDKGLVLAIANLDEKWRYTEAYIPKSKGILNTITLVPAIQTNDKQIKTDLPEGTRELREHGIIPRISHYGETISIRCVNDAGGIKPIVDVPMDTQTWSWNGKFAEIYLPDVEKAFARFEIGQNGGISKSIEATSQMFEKAREFRETCDKIQQASPDLKQLERLVAEQQTLQEACLTPFPQGRLFSQEEAYKSYLETQKRNIDAFVSSQSNYRDLRLKLSRHFQ
jgi:hypothetical protein